jgi:hypothetical protein
MDLGPRELGPGELGPGELGPGELGALRKFGATGHRPTVLAPANFVRQNPPGPRSPPGRMAHSRTVGNGFPDPAFFAFM